MLGKKTHLMNLTLLTLNCFWVKCLFVHCLKTSAPHFADSKKSHLLHNQHRSIHFVQYFINYHTSWNNTLFSVFSAIYLFLCLLNAMIILLFGFLKISMFHILYLSCRQDPFSPISKSCQFKLWFGKEKEFNVIRM